LFIVYCYNFGQSLYQQNHVAWHNRLSLFKTVIRRRNSASKWNVFDQNKLLYEKPYIFVLSLICRANIFLLRFKSMSTRGPGRGDTCYLTDFSEIWPDWRTYPITQGAKTVLQLQFSGGSYTTPLLFLHKFFEILH